MAFIKYQNLASLQKEHYIENNIMKRLYKKNCQQFIHSKMSSFGNSRKLNLSDNFCKHVTINEWSGNLEYNLFGKIEFHRNSLFVKQ